MVFLCGPRAWRGRCFGHTFVHPLYHCEGLAPGVLIAGARSGQMGDLVESS